VIISPRPPDDPDLIELTAAQQAELAAHEGEDWVAFALHDDILYLVGLVDGQAVACGALQTLDEGLGEIKRMYVVPHRRGQGLSRRMLVALEELARRKGFRTLRLETGPYLEAALGLYTSSGYQEIPRYGQYVDSEISICLEKDLDV
jgi:GNAT superfamily N-acetyltransferase